MTKLSTIFLFLAVGLVLSLQGQTIIQDFEPGSPAVTSNFGADVSVVANPDTQGNATANVARVGRTSANWYELLQFTLATPYVVPAGETRYLNVLVHYPALADIALRLNEDNSTDSRATNINTLNEFGVWKELVFEVSGDAGGVTVNVIQLFCDAGFQNGPNPSGNYVLNNTDAVAYIDQFTFTETSVLEVNDFKSDDRFAILPNPTKAIFKIENASTISNIEVFDMLGKQVKNISKLNRNEFDVSDLRSGLYVVRILDDKGGTISKRLLKQ